MADPTLGLSFNDLILRIAEFLGVADYTAAVAGIPTDAHDLDLCKRLANDGYRRYVNANPLWNITTPPLTITFNASYRGTAQSGTTTTLTDTTLIQPAGVNFVGMIVGITAGTGINQFATVSAFNQTTGVLTFSAMAIALDSTSQYSIATAACVNGDNSRYYMPDNFMGELLSPWTYDQYGPRMSIQTIHEGRIRELLSGSKYVGTPTLVAIRPVTVSNASSGGRWEAVFYPAPAGPYNVTTRIRIYPQALVNLTDRHIFGPVHDEGILACGLAEAEQQRNDTIGTWNQKADAAIARQIRLDQGSAPKRLGGYGDRSEERMGMLGKRPLSYYAVDTYNGIPV